MSRPAHLPSPRVEPGRVPRLDATQADFVVRVSAAGRLLAASDTVADVLGWNLLECASAGIWSAIADEAQRAAMRQVFTHVLVSGEARSTLQLTSVTGSRWVDVAAKHLLDEPGAPILLSARDVSDEIAASLQLAASEMRWRVAFEHSPIGGALLDHDGSILVVNEALCRTLGWRADELTRMDLSDLMPIELSLPWHEWWNDLLSDVSEASSRDRIFRTASDGRVWGRVTAALVASAGLPPRVMLQLEDVTRRREAELELANRALHDGLTGAPNRFLTRRWLASALEDHPGGRVGVLYCDLDRFKIVNDSLGHAAGDSLLVQVAERLRGPLRPEDLLGRVGGDEFVMVMEGVTTPGELAEIAGRLMAALDEPFELGGHRHAMTLSLGGTIGTQSDTADDVLMRADMALLRAKRLGRARYEAFDPAHDRVATRADLQLEDELRVSLDAHELRAYYQPIVSLDDLCVVGHEALVRWEHPEHGLLLPALFLDLAESSGLIRPLGWWMLSQACHDATRGDNPLREPGWVAVNASPSQLARPGVAADVVRALVASGLPPHRLHLEITETALITASAGLVGELRELSEMGVRIALDDFGTGYSSLSLLRQFPVDLVKIDRSFIEPVLTDRSALAIVKAVLSMCRDMNLPTVAEGVETRQQLDLLRELGCSNGQGFLFGRPVPVGACSPTPPHPRTRATAQIVSSRGSTS
ncbi:MAG: bifunctional diguanylate cyclase/phosphodiesterase [Actinomycetota bacterium]|nr:bifunctional diguanylate cyclase/phosphodiesterase [Actinomycetota bacterium]